MPAREAILGEANLPRGSAIGIKRKPLFNWARKIRWRPVVRTGLFTLATIFIAGGATLGAKRFKAQLKQQDEYSEHWGSATNYVTTMRKAWESDKLKFRPALDKMPELPTTAEEMVQQLNSTTESGVFYYYVPGPHYKDIRGPQDKIIKVEYDGSALKRVLNRFLTPQQIRALADVYNDALLYNEKTSEQGRWWHTVGRGPNGDEWKTRASPFFAALAFSKKFDEIAPPHVKADKNSVLAQTTPEKMQKLKKQLDALTAAKRVGGAVGGAVIPLLLSGTLFGLLALRELRLNSKFRRSLKRAVENGNAQRIDDLLKTAGLSLSDAAILGVIPKSLVLDAGGFSEAVADARVAESRKPVQSSAFALRALNLLPGAPSGVAETALATPIRVEGPVRMAVGVSSSKRKRDTAPPPKLPIDFPLSVLSLAETFGSMSSVPKIEFHVADEIAKLNRRLLLGESEAEAAAAVENETQQKIAAINATVNALGLPSDKIFVGRWSDLQKTLEFQRGMQLIREAEAKGGSRFRNDLLKLLPASVNRLIKARAREKVSELAASGGVKGWIQKRRFFNETRREMEELALEYARQDMAHALLPGLRVQHAREDAFNAAAENLARKHGLRVAEPAKLDFSAAPNTRKAKSWFLNALRPGPKKLEGQGFTFTRSAETGLNYATLNATAKLSRKARPEPYLSDKAENTIHVGDMLTGKAIEKINAKGKTPDDVVKSFALATPSLLHVLRAQQRGELPSGSLFQAAVKIINAVNAATPELTKTSVVPKLRKTKQFPQPALQAA
ncbi:MAG: hypothetical protein V1817_05090 [Candidatus Micrarchaeota archaeon]